MAGLTAAQIDTLLADSLTQRTAVKASQEYAIGDQSIKQALLKDIDAAIDKYHKMAVDVANGGMKVQAITLVRT